MAARVGGSRVGCGVHEFVVFIGKQPQYTPRFLPSLATRRFAHVSLLLTQPTDNPRVSIATARARPFLQVPVLQTPRAHRAAGAPAFFVTQPLFIHPIEEGMRPSSLALSHTSSPTSLPECYDRLVLLCERSQATRQEPILRLLLRDTVARYGREHSDESPFLVGRATLRESVCRRPRAIIDFVTSAISRFMQDSVLGSSIHSSHPVRPW